MRITPIPVPPALTWTCPDCGTQNISVSTSCSGCSRARGQFQKIDGSDQTVQDALKEAVRADRKRTDPALRSALRDEIDAAKAEALRNLKKT